VGNAVAVAARESGQALAGRHAETDAQVVAMWTHGKAANTARAYRREALRFAAFVGAPLPAVTLGDVQAYADSLAAAGLSVASQVRALAAVKSLLSFAHTVGYTPANVGAAEKLPALPLTLAERIVPAETIAALIEGETNPRSRVLLRVLYYGGLRESEACGLRWRDVQARGGGRVQVTVFGKGGKTRAVPLPPHVAEGLTALRGDAETDAPVFVGRRGALSAGQVWRIVKAAGERVGVPALSPHWLRHAHASHALDNGATPVLVRDTLGHASLATTSRYMHARPGDSSGLYLPAV
jgi:integrase/recombinase XerD